jgi:hypothetical protein
MCGGSHNDETSDSIIARQANDEQEEEYEAYSKKETLRFLLYSEIS